LLLFICILESSKYDNIDNLSTLYFIENISTSIIEIIETIFIANGGAKGTDFLCKYFSISFVVSIRFTLVIMPLYLLYLFSYDYLITYHLL
jgi:hypothetical protein